MNQGHQEWYGAYILPRTGGSAECPQSVSTAVKCIRTCYQRHAGGVDRAPMITCRNEYYLRIGVKVDYAPAGHGGKPLAVS